MSRRRSLIAPTEVHTAVQLSVVKGNKTGTRCTCSRKERTGTTWESKRAISPSSGLGAT
jgi:hypothetical protein